MKRRQIKRTLHRYYYTKQHTYKYKNPVDVVLFTDCEAMVKVDGDEFRMHAYDDAYIPHVREIALRLAHISEGEKVSKPYEYRLIIIKRR